MTDARAQDAVRFEAFLLEFQDMVYATAVRLLGNPSEAEDVAQTVFLKAFERFDQIGTSAAAAGWLKTVTTNVCLNHLSRYRNRWRFFSELGTADTLTVEQRSAGPQDPNSVLDLALRRLPPHQRVPIVLFHFDELSYQEIAERLGVSVGKVKTDIHRGRMTLRAALGSRLQERPAR